MENFKMRLKKRIVLFSAVGITAAVLGIYNFIVSNDKVEGSLSEGIVSGFQFGLILGIGILALIETIKLNKVIRDEKRLRMHFNAEQDERLKAIRSKAGMPMLLITSVLMLIAAIIAGYVNITVFYTLIAAAMVQLTIGLIVKVYCMNTM